MDPLLRDLPDHPDRAMGSPHPDLSGGQVPSGLPDDDALLRLARLAARLLRAPAAFVALREGEGFHFRACVGLGAGEPERLGTLCTRVLAAGTVLTPPAQASGPRSSPVARLPFYAAAPLVTPGGEGLGVLAVLDTAPRPPLAGEDAAALLDLVPSVVGELERRMVQSGAGQAAALHTALLETTPDAIVTLGARGRVSEWNPAAERLFGYAAREMLGQDNRAALGLLMGEAADTFLHTAPARSPAGECFTVLRRRDGHTFCAEVTVLPLNLGAERVHTLIVRDCTRQQEVQNELTGQRNLLRAALDGVPESMYVKDPQRRYLMINTAGARAIGRPPEEILGRADEELWPADIAATVRLRDEQVLRSGRQVTYEVTDELPDGRTKAFWTTRTVYRDGEGAVAGLIGVSIDITERKVAEEVLRRHTESLSRRVEDAQLEILERLAYAAEYRDDDTGEHMYRVGHTAAGLAQMLGLPADEVELIRRAAPLHDVGKVGIPDGILLKPGRLTPEEFEVVRTHCRIGAQILRGGRSPLIRMAETIALTHHERWDGQGYPAGLVGEATPAVGRIVAVADVLDALTSTRPYKRAWPVEEALAEISAQSGRQFDPQVVEALHRWVSASGMLSGAEGQHA